MDKPSKIFLNSIQIVRTHCTIWIFLINEKTKQNVIDECNCRLSKKGSKQLEKVYGMYIMLQHITGPTTAKTG